MDAPAVVFEGAISPLVTLARQLGPEAQARLRQAGLPLDGPILAAYPVEQWAAWVGLFGQVAHPELAPLEAHRRIGAATARLFMETAIGRALFTLLRLIGPHRALARLTRSLRTANNFIEATTEVLGPGHHQVRLNEVSGLPGFYLGLLETAVSAVGASELQVELRGTEGRSATYALRWREG